MYCCETAPTFGHRVLIVGSGVVAEQVRRHRADDRGVEVVGMVDDDPAPGSEVIGRIDEIARASARSWRSTACW